MYAVKSWEDMLLTGSQIHARLGEVLYISGASDTAKDNAETVELLHSSVQRFCRSIELCDDYLRGYYGLKMVSSKS